jgi:crotonobetainyl-CoA:carnitine CoA-transferase CaiB-like acyl-CoA transferase
MIAGNAWAYSDDFCTYAGKPPVPVCDDEYYGTNALDRVYEAAGGSWVYLAVPSDREFAAFAQASGLAGLVEDERFATEADRRANDDALAATLASHFAGKPAAEWESVLSSAGVGCAEVNMKGHPAFIALDPVLRDTGLTVTYQHPVYGELVRLAPPVKFSETPGRVAPPPLRGEHNRSVLSEVGYGAEEITELEERGILIPVSDVSVV